MSAMSDQALPLRILIHALGGEGGGVLMNWIVSAATAAGRKVQATSVPGVAQRTGSTTYYIEIAPPGTDPVMGLSPMPGRVDVVLASELVEAARAMEAGFVSPRLTTLIASTNRVYATAEKIQMGDGRKDDARVVAAARALARTSHLHDLDALARENGTFISATLYGALLGSGVLPWDRAMSLAVLGQGRGAEASRRGVEAAERAVQGIRAAQPAPSRPEAVPEEPGPVDGLLPPPSARSRPTGANGCWTTRATPMHGFIQTGWRGWLMLPTRPITAPCMPLVKPRGGWHSGWPMKTWRGWPT